MKLADLSIRLTLGVHAPVTPDEVASLLGMSCDDARALCLAIKPLHRRTRGLPVYKYGDVLEHVRPEPEAAPISVGLKLATGTKPRHGPRPKRAA